MPVRGSRRRQEVIDQSMRSALAFFLVSTAVSISSTALTAAEVLRATVTVRVYQTAGLPSAVEQRALAEAETVLRAALVDVQWRRCTGQGQEPSPACDAPLGPGELSLRIVREGPSWTNGTVATLGAALVDRRAGGVLATVYVNAIAALAIVAGTDAAVLLGRAAAHELGHLLMASTTHRRQGLMRPKWTRDEVRRDRTADWTFGTGDVATIRRRIPHVR